jgi:hypothetical protein
MKKLHFFALLLIGITFSFCNGQDYPFIQQIGSESDNLSENAISVNKNYPNIILTQHNSTIGNTQYTKTFTSHDGGHTWASVELDINSWCDPSVVITPNSKMCYSYMVKSDDYISINMIKLGIPLITASNVDKPYLWSDNSNNLYCSFKKKNPSGNMNAGMYVFRYSANGGLWSQIFYNAYSESDEFSGVSGIRGVCNNGNCNYFTWNAYNGCLYFATNCKSDDGSWTVSIVTNEFYCSMYETPVITLNRKTGKLYIAYIYDRAGIQNAKYYSSEDGGITWSDNYFHEQHNSDPEQENNAQSYVWIASESNTTHSIVTAVYYNFAKNNSYKKVEIAYSTNDGANWSYYNNININGIPGSHGAHDYSAIDAAIDNQNQRFIVYPVYSDANSNYNLSYIAPFAVAFSDDGDKFSSSANKLYQNKPNPFNPVTTIRFKISEASNINLKVYDLLGKLISILADDYKTPGEYSVVFDAKNLPSGVYYYKLETKNGFEIKRMIVIK